MSFTSKIPDISYPPTKVPIPEKNRHQAQQILKECDLKLRSRLFVDVQQLALRGLALGSLGEELCAQLFVKLGRAYLGQRKIEEAAKAALQGLALNVMDQKLVFALKTIQRLAEPNPLALAMERNK